MFHHASAVSRLRNFVILTTMRRVFLLSISVLLSSSFKILVYNSKFGHSNINFLGNVADILADAGHNVTTLLPEIDPSWGDGTIKSKTIRLPQSGECKQATRALAGANLDWFSLDMLDPFGILQGTPYSDRFALQCKGTLEQTELIAQLKSDKFDVMIAENFDMCGIGLSHLIKPKALINGATSALKGWMIPELGLAKAWSYDPSPLTSDLDVHSLWSRLKNIYAEAMYRRFLYSSRSMIEKLFKDKFGDDFPSVMDISSHAAYSIVNSEPLVDFATPTLSRIIYIGGLGAKVPIPIDKQFDDVLNLRSKTVLISFGSLIASSKLPVAVKKTIVETGSMFPHVSFIWKYEVPDDDFAKEARKIAPNLNLFKWLPQNDLLGDPRVTAFITHAGMGSAQETIVRGKPGLFIPCFGDQPRNAAMMERSGLGKVFQRRDLLVEGKFAEAVTDLLDNESYYTHARRIAEMIANKPFSSKELLIRTVEFAAEFGPSAALRPQSYDMSLTEYYNLDIIAVLAASVLVSGSALIAISLAYFKRIVFSPN